MREHRVELLLEMPPVIESREAVGLRHVAQPFVRLEKLPLPLFELLLQSLDAQHRLEARFELGELDRLGDVVVCARLEPLDLVFGRIERRLHDDRNEGQVRVRLYSPGDFHSVDVRHHDVEENQIRRLGLDLLQRLPPIHCRLGRVAPRLESRAQQLDVVLVIVDDQNARRWFVLISHCPSRGSAAPRRPRRVARTASRDIRHIPLPSPSPGPRPRRAPSAR